MKDKYPNFGSNSSDFILEEIVTLRNDDIAAFQNLVNILVRGRKVDKIPATSADVTATDAVGDINYDASFLYILVDNAGAAVWRRVALSSF